MEALDIILINGKGSDFLSLCQKINEIKNFKGLANWYVKNNNLQEPQKEKPEEPELNWDELLEELDNIKKERQNKDVQETTDSN